MQLTGTVAAFAALAALLATAEACGDGGDGDTLRAPWEATSADGTDVTLSVGTGSVDCGELGKIKTVESAESVEIRVFIHDIGHGTCAALYGRSATTVTLDAPLGDRILIGCEREAAGRDFIRRADEGCRGFS